MLTEYHIPCHIRHYSPVMTDNSILPALAETDRRRSRKIDPGELKNPLVCKGYERWCVLRGDRRFPARPDISPRDLGPLLKNIALIRVLDGGHDYEFRVVGDAIVQIQRFLYQGLTTSLLERKWPGYTAHMVRIFGRVRRTGEVYAVSGHYEAETSTGAFYHETVFLPLGPDDGTVDHILAVGVHAAS
ncbi:MAG: PAS domain-containing protein [Alphaproteobacteria bacterium]|nr:PAS domain-containing protein [Alphaproteobacteria bacterium]